ncbi:hypothetical protein NL676_035344 [Syzygium grande]|nr:hypothetical protein NL676_035344 [Syzygium grande]
MQIHQISRERSKHLRFLQDQSSSICRKSCRRGLQLGRVSSVPLWCIHQVNTLQGSSIPSNNSPSTFSWNFSIIYNEFPIL